jgi:hypothetical protein
LCLGAPSRHWGSLGPDVLIALLPGKIRVRSEQPGVPLAPSPQADAESPPHAAEPVHLAPPDWATGILPRMGEGGGPEPGAGEGPPRRERANSGPQGQVRIAAQRALGDRTTCEHPCLSLPRAWWGGQIKRPSRVRPSDLARELAPDDVIVRLRGRGTGWRELVGGHVSQAVSRSHGI